MYRYMYYIYIHTLIQLMFTGGVWYPRRSRAGRDLQRHKGREERQGRQDHVCILYITLEYHIPVYICPLYSYLHYFYMHYFYTLTSIWYTYKYTIYTKLHMYRYGGMLEVFVEEMVQRTRLGKGHSFLDIGSGIGQVCTLVLLYCYNICILY